MEAVRGERKRANEGECGVGSGMVKGKFSFLDGFPLKKLVSHGAINVVFMHAER